MISIQIFKIISLILIAKLSIMIAWAQNTPREDWQTLNNAAFFAFQSGDYSAGLEHAKQAYELAMNAFGERDQDTLTSIYSLGLLYLGERRFNEAEPYVQRALRLSNELLGERDPQTIRTLGLLRNIYLNQSRYEEAEPLLQQELELNQEALSERPDLLATLAQLGVIYGNNGQFDKAEVLLQQALELSRKNFGDRHPAMAAGQINLALVYFRQARLSEAEALFQEALKLSREFLGDHHEQTLEGLSGLGVIYMNQGRYAEAEPILKEVLHLRREILGARHPSTLYSLYNLAGLYSQQGRYGDAKLQWEQALQLSREVLGERHPDTIFGISMLGQLLMSQGHIGKAEQLVREALELNREVLGANDPNTLATIIDLAMAYQMQGRLEEAGSLLQQVLDISRKALGERHPSTFTALNNLGLLHLGKNPHEAESYFKRALQISRDVLGNQHPQTLLGLNNLGSFYLRQGRFSEAELLLQEALQLSRENFGEQHPNVAMAMMNIAGLRQQQSHYSEAEPLYQQALLLSRKIYGDHHPITLVAQLERAINTANLGRIAEALRELQRIEPALLTWLGGELYSTENAVVRSGLVASQSAYQHVVLSLALQVPEQPAAQQLAASSILRFKGLIAEEETYLARVARRGQDPRAQELAGEIAALRARLARAFHGAGEVDIDALKHELDAKELALGKVSRDYAQHLQVRNANLADLQLTLDPGEALLELRQYQKLDIQKLKPGEERYAGILITGSGITIEDLGAITLPESFDDRAGRELYEQLLAPFAAPLQSIKTLYLAPDGPLHLLPFAALRQPDGRHVVEALDLRLVQTGRDLLRPGTDRPAKGLLALGGIDFDRAATEMASIEPAAGIELQGSFLLPLDGDELRSLTEASFRDGFKALPASRNEVVAIRDLYQVNRRDEPAEIWQDQKASEMRLKSLARPPRVLHLATHGFYRQQTETADRPMLLAGVTLSGANQALKDAEEDGILYAIEAQGLNLEGTELVVLSACDTAKGQPAYGEGVYGLVRALRTAGAANILVTLSPVQDTGASQFMQAFYSHMLQKDVTPAEALRTTKLDYINSDDQNLNNPNAWAPYQLIGG